MKKHLKILSVILAAVMLASAFLIRQPVQAAYCEHEPDTSAAYDYRNDTDDDTQVITYAKCRKCGEWYVYCDPRTHAWEQTDVGIQSCTSDGYYTVECSRCGASFTHVTGKAYGHTWGSWTVTRQPSCTADGEQMRTCDECHETEVQALPAAGHQWGEWIVTSAPSAEKPGEERRTCTVCGTVETREVASTGIYAKAGDTCFEVFIAKQLLEEAGLYDGDIDYTFDDVLGTALQSYQQAQNFPVSGELTAETLQALAEDFAGSYGEDIPADGRLRDFDAGLLVYPVFESSYANAGNGTHVRTSVFTGVRFRKGADERSFAMPSNMRLTLDPVHEPCLVANTQRICPCGYQDTYKTEAADLAFFLTDGIVAVPLDLGMTEDGLYEMLDIIYDEEGGFVYWDEVPGAVLYTVELSCYIDDNWEVYKTFTTETAMFSTDGLPSDDYIVCIQAFDEGQEAVSIESFGNFSILTKGLAAPQNAVLGCGTVSWTDPNTKPDISFIVHLAAYSSEGKEIWKAEKETAETYADFTKELALKYDFPAGTVLRGEAAAKDNSGAYPDSAFTQTNDTPWVRPYYYRALSTVNVRSGPGKEYSRTGGLSKGDIVPCYGTETGTDGATYLQIGYHGSTAYVNASFLTMFVPVNYSVQVDLGNGNTIDVGTNPDGTIDMDDFYAQASLRKNGRIGYTLEGFYLDSERWDIGESVPEDTTLQTKWNWDMSCIFVDLYYQNGASERVFIPIGETYPELKQEADCIWTTEKNGQGSIITVYTVYTAAMNGQAIYQSSVTGMDITLGTYAGHCPDIFRQLYSVGSYPAGSLGVLQDGDRLRVEAFTAGTPETVSLSTGSLTIRNEWLKVYSYRLDQTGWIMAELLRNSYPGYRAVYFDPNGGTMDVRSLKVRFDSAKNGYYIGVYPDARRDGYALAGWADADGNFMTRQTEITQDGLKLTAVWTDEMPYAEKSGVTYAEGETKVKYYDDPDGEYSGRIPVATEVRIIRESGDKYFCVTQNKTVWISKDDIVTEYNKLTIDRTAEFYADHTLNIMGKKPQGIVHKGEVGYQLESALLCYGVLMPPYPDERPDPMYVWVHKRYATQGFTLTLEAAPGQCSIRSMQLPPVTYQEYDGWSALVYVRDKGGRIEMLPKARLAGYAFAGWYTDPIGGVRVHVGELVQSNMTVYAHYEGLYDERIMVVKDEAKICTKGANGKFNSVGTIKPGTVGVARLNSEQEGVYMLISFGGESWWIRRGSLIWSEAMTVTQIDENTDIYVRKDPKSKGKKYREIGKYEIFVVVDEEDGWYKVAYPESDTGFAYVRCEHFE